VFEAGPNLPPDVAHAFAEATREVSLDRAGLGIVIAALSGQPAISRLETIPADGESTSGHWLRAFGASRSVAVPLLDDEGQCLGVLAVAVPASCHLADSTVVQQIHLAASQSGNRLSMGG
jgi:hypothetical protein